MSFPHLLSGNASFYLKYPKVTWLEMTWKHTRAFITEMKITLLWHRQSCSILDLCLLGKPPLAVCWGREVWAGLQPARAEQVSSAPVSSCSGNWQQGEVCSVTLRLSSWPPCRKAKTSIWPSVYLTGSVPGKEEKSPHTVWKFIKYLSRS